MKKRKKHKLLDAREVNALINKFLREGRELYGIVGPSRADLYANARLVGRTPEQAEAIARRGYAATRR